MGPVTGDHWFVFTAEPKLDRCLAESSDRNLDMMMFDIDPEVAKIFFKSDLTSAEVTTLSGIASIMPGAVINDWMFDPCGYSLNALNDATHYTIHVTPEPICSFVSFATNAKVEDYSVLINQVLEIFKPRKFTATLFADLGGSSALNHSNPNPFRVYYK